MGLVWLWQHAVVDGRRATIMLPGGWQEERMSARPLNRHGPLMQTLEPRLMLSGLEYPADSGIVNLSLAPYLAIPNDGLDDTAAIQQAIQDYSGAGGSSGTSATLYLPDGVYNISNTIAWVSPGKKLSLQGQSRDGTILRLADNCTGFTDAAATRIVLDIYCGNVQDAFGNYVHDLTVDTGSGNTGATGIRFQSSNYGSLRNVAIRTSDSQRRGVVGLNMSFNSPGPLLVKNVSVDGFDRGITTAGGEHSVKFESITLTNQKVYGLENWRQPLSIYGLTSVNSVPAVHGLNGSTSAAGWGQIVLVNASLTGGASNQSAIVNDSSAGVIFVRNVTTSGYQSAIKEFGSVKAGANVTEYATDAAKSVFSSPGTSLNLAVEDAVLPADPASQWVNVRSFGAVADDEFGDSDAIQAAIDSGAATLYFPQGTYYIDKTIEIRGNVHAIMGLQSNFEVWSGTWEQGPAIRVVDGNNRDTLLMDQFYLQGDGGSAGPWLEQASTRTLVIRDAIVSRFRNSVPGGKLFIEDVCGGDWYFDHTKVWARQLNPENSGTKITNHGSDLWILGLKTEKTGTIIATYDRGRTEVLGGMLYPSSGVTPADTPAFINDNSSLSFSITEESWVDPRYYTVWVDETRGASHAQLLRSALTRNHCNYGKMVTLYTGYVADTSAGSVPGGLAAAAVGTSAVRLTWTAASDAQSGIQRYNIYRDGQYIGAARGSETAFTDSGAADGVAYAYSVRAVNGAGLEGAAATASGRADADLTPPTIDSTAVDTQGRRVLVTFGEAVTAASAQTLANYALAGATVSGASLLADGRTVALSTTAALTSGTAYTLTVNNIRDRSTAGNAIAADSHAVVVHNSAPAGSGLSGAYYDTSSFGSYRFTQTDGTVNFSWGTGYPAGLTSGDTFSVRWSGLIQPRYTETCTFYVNYDDGCRLWVNGVLVVNDWNNGTLRESSGTVALTAGQKYDIVLEYYENTSSATCQLSWSSAHQAREIVPRECLSTYPAATSTLRAVADSQVSQSSTNDLGANLSMNINCQTDGSQSYYSSAWIRFDLSGLDLVNNDISAATFLLTVHGGDGTGSGLRTMQLFGLNDSAAGQDWIETGTDHITWGTAPGNNNTGGHADGTTATWLGTFVVDNTGYIVGNKGDFLKLATQRLLDFLRADTDGKVTLFVKKPVPNWSLQTLMVTHEDASKPAPGLAITLTPKASAQPASAALAAASDTGVSTSDQITNRDNTAGKTLQFTVGGTTAGSTIRVYAGGRLVASGTGAAGSTTVTTDGAFDLADGNWSIWATQTVTGRSESPNRFMAGLLTVDTVAPAAPAAPDLQAGSDSGFFSTDNITRMTSPVLDIAAGPYWRLLRGGVQISGDWATASSFTDSLASAGPYAYTLKAVDAAGNVSPASAALAVTLDLTGAAGSGNAVNGGSAQRSRLMGWTVSFSEAVEVDSSTAVLHNDGSGQDVPITAAAISGNRTTAVAWDTSALAIAPGNYTVTIRTTARDVAGNDMPAAYGFSMHITLGDFSGDGTLAADDIDALAAAVRSGSTSLAYDLNASGTVNWDDHRYLYETLLTTRQGDTNLDRAVAIGDLVALAQNWQQPAGWAGGDSSGDGVVTIGDLVALAQNWGWHATAGMAVADSEEVLLPAGQPSSAAVQPATPVTDEPATLMPELRPRAAARIAVPRGPALRFGAGGPGAFPLDSLLAPQRKAGIASFMHLLGGERQ
jgi:hypothetical protein